MSWKKLFGGAALGLGDALGVLPGGTFAGGFLASKDERGQDLLDPGYYFHKSPQERAYDEKVSNATKRTADTYDQLEQMLNEYNANRTRFSTPEMQETYKQLISDFNPEEYVGEVNPFEFEQTREDFVNPYREKILADVGKAVQGTAAGAGLGMSRGTLTNAIQAQMDKDEQLWKDANQMFNQERDFAYKNYADSIANNQKRLDALLTARNQQVSMLGGAIGQDTEAESDYMRDLMTLLGDKTQSLNNIELSNKEATRSPVDIAAKILPFFA